MARHSILIVTIALLSLNGFAAQFVEASDRVALKTIVELVKEAQEGVNFISIDQLNKRIKENKKLALLDVRTQREYDAGHIKGSAWLERGIAEFVLARTLPIQDAEIIVYCKKGNRTGLVVKALKAAGYTNVAGLEGGFDEWTRQGGTVHNFLGEFKMIKPRKIDASSFAVDFYQEKD